MIVCLHHRREFSASACSGALRGASLGEASSAHRCMAPAIICANTFVTEFLRCTLRAHGVAGGMASSMGSIALLGHPWPNLSLNADAPRRRASPPSFVAPVSLVR